MSKSRQEVEGEITDLWVTGFKRDPELLNLDKFDDKQLRKGLLKLKSIKMGLEILISDKGGTGLALHLLSEMLEDGGEE